MTPRRILAFLTAGLLAIGVFFYLHFRTGFEIEVLARNWQEPVGHTPLTNARVRVWLQDSLVATAETTPRGKSSFHLDPGTYEIRVDGEGFITAVLSSQTVERFSRPGLRVVLNEPPGQGSRMAWQQSIDTTSVLVKASPEDIWRTWFNKLTGMPHRVVGSAIRLAQAPRTEAEAAQAARETLTKYIDDNKDIHAVLAGLDPATLYSAPVVRLKGGWVVTFGQQVDLPLSAERVPVFGSEASVVIRGEAIVQFGLDLFPDIAVRADTLPLALREIVTRLKKYEAVEEVDSTHVRLVIFPEPKQQNPASFDYKLAYQLYASRHSNQHEQSMAVWHYVVEAANGRTLFAEKLSTTLTNGHIKMAILDKSPEESPATMAPLSSGLIGSDSLGYNSIGQKGEFTLPDTTSLQPLSILLINPNFSMFKEDSPRQPVFYLTKITPPRDAFRKSLADTNVNISNATDGIADIVLDRVEPQFNTFYHLNRARAYFAERCDVNVLNNPVDVFVVSDADNAFYLPNPASGTDKLVFGRFAESLGLRSDVIYHEYSHGVLYRLLSPATPSPHRLSTRDETGAIHEALADYFACSLNGDPEVRVAAPTDSVGKQYNRVLRNKLSYPEDFKVGVRSGDYAHENSQILSGILWDLREQMIEKLNSAEKGGRFTDDLILKALKHRPLAATFEEFSVNLLLADEEDSRLATSSPNYREIKRAFKKHGIEIPQFELTPPTIKTFTLTTVPGTKAGHLEEGRQVRVTATVVETGSGLLADSLRLEINGQQVDRSNLRVRLKGQTTRVTHFLKNKAAIRRSEFGDSIKVVLFVEDLAGNKARTQAAKPILDTIAPQYDLVGCDYNLPYIYLEGELKDFGSGIDPSSLLLTVNGRKITGMRLERINDYNYTVHLNYPFKIQKYSVYGRVSDKAGNVAERRETKSNCLSPCLTMISAVIGMFLMRGRKARQRPASR
ncbi:MAG: M36 family metallopeptidase [bacterium]